MPDHRHITTMAGWPHARQWLFSLKAFAAAMLALYIALFFGLPRPYWAMATVYFVSNPLTGATRSKAAYRVAGTLLGATAAVVTVPQLVNMPIVLMGAISLWIMVLVYLSLLQRSPRSYVFLLAAYTLPIVALPAGDASRRHLRHRGGPHRGNRDRHRLPRWSGPSYFPPTWPARCANARKSGSTTRRPGPAISRAPIPAPRTAVTGWRPTCWRWTS
jgi:hypothetical protein